MKKNLMYYLLVVVCGMLTLSACQKDEQDLLPPAEVSNLSVQIGNKEVLLSWEKPSDTDLKEYWITISPDGMTFPVDKNETGYVVKQLTNGKAYTFTIKTKDEADNLSQGVSVEAIPVNPIPPSVVYEGNITFATQAALDAFDAKYTFIEGDVVISGADITGLSGLSKIDSIGGKLEIYFNDNLVSFEGLNKLKWVDGSLYLRGNKLVANVNGFENLQHIVGDLTILDMAALTNLSGLSKLGLVGGSIYIGTEAWKNPPKNRPNALLADFCGLKKLFVANGLTGTYYAANNASNPTVAEIKTNCP
jgi:hypothetical protein